MGAKCNACKSHLKSTFNPSKPPNPDQIQIEQGKAKDGSNI